MPPIVKADTKNSVILGNSLLVSLLSVYYDTNKVDKVG